MKYGQIAGNKSINAMIYTCFEHVDKGDVPRFLKKFRQQSSNNTQVMHTFRELILGAYLVSRGFNAKYECKINSETPDWCVLNGSSTIVAIVELMNFHLDRTTENDIQEQIEGNSYWVGWQQTNVPRLYARLWRKIRAYKDLVNKHGVPYILAVFGEFTAAVNLDELQVCLCDSEFGLFSSYPELSGVLFFEEASGQYEFIYLPNPHPLKGLTIQSGKF